MPQLLHASHSQPINFCSKLEDLIAHDMFALLEAIQINLAFKLASARVRE